jgi:hypothetical protein
MKRRGVVFLVAGAVLIGVLIGILNRRGSRDSSAAAAGSKSGRGGASQAIPVREALKFAPVQLTPSAAGASKPCREIVARALLAKAMRPGFIALSLAALHRGNPAFIEMADAFCAQAGDDLVPICRDLLSDLGSEASAALVAAILGHSRRGDAFDLLKELAVKGKGPPESPELFASAVYSIGMLRSDKRVPYLLGLFRETPNAGASVSSKFGTALMAAVGMCGKEGVAMLREAALNNLDPKMQIEPDEGLRSFRWSYLGLVSSPEALGELKSIADRDPDIRLRGMAIAALGQSPDAGQRAYLSELYLRDDNPEIRRAILESLHDGAKVSQAEWEGMRDRMAGPLASILKATKVPSGNEHLDAAAIFLAAKSGHSEYVNDWIRAASGGAYAAGDVDWIDMAVHALAVQGGSADRIDELLEGKGVSKRDRVSYLVSMQNQSESAIGGLAVARELIDYAESAPNRDGAFLNCFHALGKMPEAREEVEACLDRLMAREGGRIPAIQAAQSAGEAGLRPLEKVIRNSGELPVVLHASQAYLRSLPEGAVLDPAVDERMKTIFSSRAIESFHAGVQGAHNESPGAFARTVGLYFGRFGTARDLAWLESLPRLLNNLPNAGQDQVARFRQELAWECARAADAIRLRAR